MLMNYNSSTYGRNFKSNIYIYWIEFQIVDQIIIETNLVYIFFAVLVVFTSTCIGAKTHFLSYK